MKKALCSIIIIITLLFPALPAFATTYYASSPVYVTTSEASTTVTQSEILWGVAGAHDDTITSATIKLQVQSGDSVSVNWCDSSGDTIDTTSVNTGSSTVNLSPPSGAYGASLVLTSGSATGSRWAWWYSVTNSQGNTTIFPDPETGGGSGGTTVDLSPIIDALQVIQGQLATITSNSSSSTGQLTDLITAINSQASIIGGKIDDMSGQITGQLTSVNGKLDDIDSNIVDIYNYISTPRTSQTMTTNLPNVTFDSTPPAITEPQQQPYKYDRPAPQLPSFVDSPSPLPLSPDPVAMEHEPAAIIDLPREIEQPVTMDPVSINNPRQLDPVEINEPLTLDPVARESPRTQDPVARDEPRTTDNPIQVEQPIGRDNPISPDPPLTPDPPR